MPGKASKAKTTRPPPRVAGVGDAIDLLESRRRAGAGGRAPPRRRRGDLDLDGIP